MQQRGFTLIELIIVIVILGILAVTAAPRFIDLQADARRASLDGVAAALQGGAQLVYAKAAIAGQQNAADADINLDADPATEVNIAFGYPDGLDTDAATDLSNWVEIDLVNDFTFHDDPATGFAISPAGTAFAADNSGGIQCQVAYNNAAAGGSPQIQVLGDGC